MPNQAETLCPTVPSGGDNDSTHFPLEALPSAIREFVAEGAEALPVPYELLAIPALVAAGAAIGNARGVQLKEGWQEKPSLYAAVICNSGTMKSPALEKATFPVKKHQTSDRRTWTSDATVESLARLLTEHPRGLLVIRDEWAGWVNSMNQYKDGKGADIEFYLSVWGGQSFVVDRVGVGAKGTPLFIDRPFVSVVGGIPPDVLQELGQAAGIADGFFPRILFAWPDRFFPKWTDKTISRETTKQYERMFSDLYTLGYIAKAETTYLGLTPEAHEAFIAWHNQHFSEAATEATSPFLQGCYAKYTGYCARLALIHALCTNHHSLSVPLKSIEAAIALIAYFKTQALKVDKLFDGGKRISQD